MKTREVQDKIIQLKKEKGFCILAHTYQSPEVCEIADYVGDSYTLALAAKDSAASSLLLCGVRFMAETAKILNPQKRVFLSNESAGCPMAEQMDAAYISKVKAEHPGYACVCYINTTASLKAVCDVCVTSSSAVKIINSMEEENIIFVPDCNLGSFVAAKCPDKNILLLDGGCPIHAAISAEDVHSARLEHPDALLLTHPECRREVAQLSDFVGSTTEIMEYAIKSEKREFIIGTENSIVAHLKASSPEKSFYPLAKGFICPDMRLTGLYDVLSVLEGEGKEIIMEESLMSEAKRCIDRMIELG